jgi:hypothetical protein
MPDSATTARVWVCRGIPLGRQVVSALAVFAAAALFFGLARWQGATMLVSSIIGTVFIAGFIGYLQVIAPTPFTITLDAEGITRAEQSRRAATTQRGAASRSSGEPIQIPWAQVAKVKEERFKSGKSVSLTVYKRVGERGLHRAFVIYRDDVGDFDGLLGALRTGMPRLLHGWWRRCTSERTLVRRALAAAQRAGHHLEPAQWDRRATALANAIGAVC